ncbi:MAG: oligosaccharide flippase family protein [archaeon]
MFLKQSTKKKAKAKAYFNYISKIKIRLVIFASLIILILARWLANNYYQKPIFYALLAGAIYLPLSTLYNFLEVIFISKNNFKVGFIGELILQISKLIILPLLILLLISKTSNNDIILFWMFIGLSATFILTGTYYLIYFLSHNPFKNIKKQKLTKKERKKLWKFITLLSTIAISGLFFGYIDIFMLGHYISSKFIGFYQAALNLVSSITAILSVSSSALFPIFSRMKGNQLERGFKKIKNTTFTISIIILIFTILTAKLLINVIYGNSYVESTIYFQYLTILIVTFPLISLYNAYYISQKRTKIISILLISSTILNVVLNYIFINIGLMYSMSYAVIGVCIATIISRLGYLGGLILFRK